ncbi:MAG: hypothetical protein JKY34_07720 [Kordiimonadaceae bacterium]|nr:hypothetical protein [Kordiimonadaceae bacterium]
MLGKFFKWAKVIGGGSSLWLYGAVLAAGVGVGGYGVHKLYQASQVGTLKAEIRRIERQANARVVLAQAAADRATVRATQTSATNQKVKVYVPSHVVCRLGPDALRLLNTQRQ